MLELLGWEIETMELMYDKTPWEKELLEEHLEVIEEECKKIDDENLRKSLLHQAHKLLDQIGEDETIQYMRAPYIVSLQDESSITHLTTCVHEVNGANDSLTANAK